MVHRDVKPHNLMRTPQGQIKVLDFGLARCARDPDKARSQLTQQGTLMGTADYMAPEQASDSRVADARADVYSLGCTLYHLLTGRVPFPDGGTVEKIIKHATEMPVPIGSLRRDLPLGVVRAVERMMAKNVEQRYQTPGEVAEALAPWTNSSIRTVSPVTVVPAGSTAFRTGRSTIRPIAALTSNTFVVRRIRRAANWLIVVGILDAFTGMGMLTSTKVAPYLAPIAILIASLILVGAVKMKERQSYRWALCAAYLSLVPINICFPFTVFFGLRALTCLGDPQHRAAFPHG
jgi:hypothetical protein